MPRSSYGWSKLSRDDKREIIDAIVAGRATRAPRHVELDLTDRCNVACYFCNQQDLRTQQQLSFQCATRLIDELAEKGLRAVRLSGGGDPLFHPDAARILRHLNERGIAVDNVTTNAVALTGEVAQLLVDGNAHEIVISLNAADAADYHRMMAVKADRFDRVVANVAALVEIRGDGEQPAITLQFLLDRENFMRLPEMYRLGRALGVDRIAVTPVLEIPRDRVAHDLLLGPDDAPRLAPYFREVLEADRDRLLFEPSYIFNWGGWLERMYRELDVPIPSPYAIAETFKDANGGCFFGWYSMVVTGNGDVRPCCYLLQPDYPALGNVVNDSLESVWNGEAFTTMRDEMRNVLVAGERAEHDPATMKWLMPQCVQLHACFLKNGYFRGDAEFYAELGAALDRLRQRS
ncbi:MAG TPA: radical SAM protein [Thermoanaerobaculia bacterium]|nr:radical SAM protein [Thermoanaerobaculia bacterium]